MLIKQTFEKHLGPKLKEAFQKMQAPGKLKMAYRYKKGSAHHALISDLALASGINGLPDLYTDISGGPYGNVNMSNLNNVLPKQINSSFFISSSCFF